MKSKNYVVVLRKDFCESDLSDHLAPLLSEIHMGGVASLVLMVKAIDLSHFRYAAMSAQFGKTDKYVSLHLPHDFIASILSAEEDQEFPVGFLASEKGDQ